MSFSYCTFVKFPVTFLVSFGLSNSDFIFWPIYHFSDNWFNCISSELFRAELLSILRCSMKTEPFSCG